MAHACPESANGLGLGEVDALDVATLYALLTEQPVEEVLRATDNMMPCAGDEAGTWVTALPVSLTSRFAAMNDDELRNVAKLWLDQHALMEKAASPPDCSAALRALRKASVDAASRQEAVFLRSGF